MPARPVPEPDRISAEKALIRASVGERMGALPQELYSIAGTALLDRLKPELVEAEGTIFAFASMPSELSTWPTLEWLWEQDIPVALPRVRDHVMSFHAIAGPWELERGVFGILQPPASAPRRSPSEASLIIVPGLAFTRSGLRLGRGGGYYDRFLSVRPPGSRAVGVCLDLQVYDELPVQERDMPVDALVAIPLPS